MVSINTVMLFTVCDSTTEDHLLQLLNTHIFSLLKTFLAAWLIEKETL